MDFRYLGGHPEIEGPRDTEIKSDSEYIKIKRGVFDWLKIPRQEVLTVRFMPSYGDAKNSTGSNLATGALLGAGALLPALAVHHLGKSKKSLIMMQVRLNCQTVFDILFEAKKGEKTYNDFVNLFK